MNRMTTEYYHSALAMDVLAVAVVDTFEYDDGHTRVEWTAYCGAVPGQNHEEEWQNVRATGSKLPRDVAKAIFPWIQGDWRR
jgi:hypothetical protein